MRKSLIFIPDTCVLLDIVRAPVRREFSQDNALAVLEFLRLVRCGTGAVQLIVPPVVREEFDQNLATVVQDATQELERIFSTHAHANATLDLLLSREEHPRSDGAMQLINRCRELASEILGQAKQMATIDKDLTLAAHRSMRGHAPAKRGKSSLGDCLITEFALRLSNENSGSGDPSVILISSNTADYCHGRRLVDSLQVEFDAARLGYCRNWAEARWCIPAS